MNSAAALTVGRQEGAGVGLNYDTVTNGNDD